MERDLRFSSIAHRTLELLRAKRTYGWEQRVDQVVTEAKAAADKASKGAAPLPFWLTAALLFGAFAASLAAVEGGALRDGTWNDRVLTPRTI